MALRGGVRGACIGGGVELNCVDVDGEAVDCALSACDPPGEELNP